MLLNQHLKRLCEAILKGSVESENFNNLLVSAGVKLDDKEWDVANKLLEKSDEMTLAMGGKDKKVIH